MNSKIVYRLTCKGLFKYEQVVYNNAPGQELGHDLVVKCTQPIIMFVMIVPDMICIQTAVTTAVIG